MSKIMYYCKYYSKFLYIFSKEDKSLLMFILSVAIKRIACVIFKDMMKYISLVTKQPKVVTIMRFTRAI